MLELTKKGYTPEFIKFGYWAMGEDVSSIDTELSQLTELSGGNPNQVSVDGQKFEINTLADKTAYEKLQSDRKQSEMIKENAKNDLKTKIEGLNAIETDVAGLESAVGPNPLARPLTPFSGDKQRFLGSVENILSTETLDSLINAKAQGATFGALSEGELRLLQASASKIGKWAKRDDEGNVVGYSVSEADFIKEVQSLKSQMQNAYDKMNAVESGQPVQSGQKTGMVKLNGQVIPVSQAVEWAKQNPDDPKAKRVLADYGNLDASTAPESSVGAPETPGFLSNIAKEIPSLAGSIATRFGDAYSDAKTAQEEGNMPFVTGKATLRALGAAAGSINDVFGAFMKAGYNSLDEDSKKVLGDTAMTVAKTRIGQEGLELLAKGGEEWKMFKEANPERAKDIEDIGNILTAVPLSSLTSKGLKATREGLAREGLAKGVDATVEKTSDVVSKMVKSGSPVQVDDILKDQVEAGLRPEVTLQTLSPTARKGAVEAIKQGFDEGQVGMMVSMAPEDRSIATKMLKLADEANLNPRVLSRPIDLAGESLTKKTALVTQKVSEYGKAVDMAAKNLRGISVDATDLKQGATQALESLGIRLTKTGMNFENSVFKMTPALQNIIKKFHKAMPKEVTDAYQLHIFKKSIDELVEYGAKGEGLKGNAERFLKSLRNQADEILDASFDGYNAANTNFREAKQIQEAALELFGKKSGTESSIRGGQVLRSAFSNSQSRGKVLELAEMLDGYEKKILGKSSGNVLDQALFAEILEKSGMFKTQAITGFAGQIENAISKTRAVAEGIANPIKGAANAVEYGIEKVRNINPQAKREALEKLLQGILIDEPVQFDGWLKRTINSLKNKGGMSIQDITPRGAEARKKLKELTEKMGSAKTEAIKKRYAKAIQDLINREK